MQEQTTLIDPRWCIPPESLEEAKTTIKAMMQALEKAEKIIKKPDYGIVEDLSGIDFSNPQKAKEKVDKIISEIKSRPMAERKPKKPAIYIVPYYKNKPNNKGRSLLSHDLKKKAQFERYATMGTKKITKVVYRTQFPAGLKDRNQNCEWQFKPEKLVIEES